MSLNFVAQLLFLSKRVQRGSWEEHVENMTVMSLHHVEPLCKGSLVVGCSNITSAHHSFGLQGNNSHYTLPFNFTLFFSLAKSIQTLCRMQGSWQKTPLPQCLRICAWEICNLQGVFRMIITLHQVSLG